MAAVDRASSFQTPKRGRPSLYDNKTTRIRLTLKVFDSWKIMKEEMGFGNKTHSKFAEMLLRKCADSTHQDTDIMNTGNIVESGDMTGGTASQLKTSYANKACVSDVSVINPQYDIREDEMSSDSDFAGLSSDESDEEQPSSDTSKKASEKFEAKCKCFDFVGILRAPDDLVNMDTKDAEVVESTHSASENYGPETRQQRDERLNTKLKGQFDSLFTETAESEQYLQQDRVIVDVKKLLTLFERRCSNASCSEMCKVANYKLFGGIMQVSWKCANNHFGYWVSSQLLCEKNGQKIYSTSLLLALAVVLSGCQYSKLFLFSKFLGLNFISRVTYQRIQRLYIIPSVTSFWEDMKSRIWQVLSNEQLFLCSDGRNDSSSQGAKYYVNVLMEQFLNVIVDIEVTDKKNTSELENCNSMVLRYTPKTVGFQNDAFTIRTLLALIDHNSHLHRKPLLGKDGRLKYNSVFKRSDKLKISVAQEDKTYDYWTTISARVLKSRKDDKGRRRSQDSSFITN